MKKITLMMLTMFLASCSVNNEAIASSEDKQKNKENKILWNRNSR